MVSTRRSVCFLFTVIAAEAFAPPRITTGVEADAISRRRRRGVVTRIVPPKVAEYGAYGLAAYSAVELCWWGLPIGYALRHVDGALTVDAFLEVAKTPLLAAVFLWPNSWFRNGVSCKIAGALRDAAER
jgi:hypothetical protein